MIRLNPEQQVFLTERHLATLTTLRPDGTPHVVPVAATWDADRGLALVTTEDGSVKVRNVEAAAGSARAALCQVDGGRWITLEGSAAVSRDPAVLADAERRHARRHHRLAPDPRRVVLVVTVDRVMASTYMAS
ncbi:TIGR03618 family F420-dependent PPOX class oxidoreductase [Isoptericola sp. b441]|uniref:TIGR03618 family F420-dependent PPOX class oxidoreductase n=1 Tax=Actinotalea lenta TaxID=3064654 RepID=A0ABT9DAY2_9CELL|nr:MULTISPECIES: TIGR03618 family F420-dependent PPOX class oxidoreductase [unclassified Isoptericola]MDO8107439.1 TIGR03618 family F420-dependent PPOX class oxidoreductase [Isoptericola sp. b441]MDO8120899.1 TIGR03618 family F420-dependent PPOX class oxidoreductase [Isoptericola sp. b490]